MRKDVKQMHLRAAKWQTDTTQETEVILNSHGIISRASRY